MAVGFGLNVANRILALRNGPVIIGSSDSGPEFHKTLGDHSAHENLVLAHHSFRC